MPKPKRARDLGVTDEGYRRMLRAQHGMCAIPGCNRTPKTRRFHVDHNHRTGRIRGLLCHWHNRIMPKDATDAYHLWQYLLADEHPEYSRVIGPENGDGLPDQWELAR